MFPAVVHHELLKRWSSVWAILTVGPAERDDSGALDVVGDVEDLVDTSLAAPMHGCHHGSQANSSGRQHDILHAWVDGSACLEPGLARGWCVNASYD